MEGVEPTTFGLSDRRLYQIGLHQLAYRWWESNPQAALFERARYASSLHTCLVREERLELSRPCGHWGLSPARLAIPPLPHGALTRTRTEQSALTKGTRALALKACVPTVGLEPTPPRS